MKTQDFVLLLKQFAERMGKENNPHLIFWSTRLSYNIEMLSFNQRDMADTLSACPMISHKFDITNKTLNYLHLSLEMNEERLNREFNERCLAGHAGINVFEYQLQREAELQCSSSWVLKKIFALTQDLFNQITELNKQSRIPTDSLFSIINVISSNNGSYVLFDEIRNIESIDVLMPADIPPEDRDNLVMSAWSKLYDLLLESICLIILMGCVEFTFLIHCIKNDFQSFCSRLFNTPMFYDQEDRIYAIKNVEESWRYIYDEYCIYAELFPIFMRYIKTRCKIKAWRYSRFTKTPIKCKLEPLLQNNIDPKRYQDILENEMLDKIDQELGIKDDDLNNANIDRASDFFFFFFGQDTELEIKHDNSTGEQTGSQPESQLKEFTMEIANGMSGKLLRGLFLNYKLQGNPYVLMGYLGAVLKKVSLSVVDKHYDEVLKRQYQISSRTRRRYDRDLKKGKIQTSKVVKDASDNVFANLAPEHIVEIKNLKMKRKQHHREGFLTQRQLIEILRSNYFINIFNEHTGIKFKKYSAPTLQKRLHALIQLNKIKIIKTPSAFFFESNAPYLLNIAKEIIQLSKS